MAFCVASLLSAYPVEAEGLQSYHHYCYLGLGGGEGEGEGRGKWEYTLAPPYRRSSFLVQEENRSTYLYSLGLADKRVTNKIRPHQLNWIGPSLLPCRCRLKILAFSCQVNGPLTSTQTFEIPAYQSQKKQNTRFGESYTCFMCESKTRVRMLYFEIGLCSAVSFKRSRRELSIDMAEHRSVLKNYQNTY